MVTFRLDPVRMTWKIEIETDRVIRGPFAERGIRRFDANDAVTKGDCGRGGGRGFEGVDKTIACRKEDAFAASCGTCGHACTAGANQVAFCQHGTCGATCQTGFADCDHSAGNGCEANLETSTSNCGACGIACSAPVDGGLTATCVQGICP